MISETDFSDSIHDLCVRCRLGWRIAHFRPARVGPAERERTLTPTAYDASGFPDLVLVHPARKLVLFREIKSERGRLSSAQVGWRNDLVAAGADYAIWRPSDWFRIVDQLGDGRVLP